MDKRKLLILIMMSCIGAYVWRSKQTPAVYVKDTINKGVEIVRDYADRFSQNAVDLVSRLEGGFQSKAYKDAGGYSIGYGHYLGTKITEDNISRARALQLLAQDMGIADTAITRYVKVPLTQNQRDALVSFIYNVGVGAFSSSTLLKLLNAGDVQGAAKQFAAWNKSLGKVNNALVARRQTERDLFLS